MKFKTLILVICILAVPLMSQATPCPTATLASYDTAGFSCTIGAVDFSGFSYLIGTSGGAASYAVPASSVTVTPVDNSNGVGFTFTGNWKAPTGLSDAFIAFDGSISGPSTVTDHGQAAGVLLTGGVATLEDGICAGITSTPCLTQTNALSDGTDVFLTQSITTSGDFTLGKDLTLNSGAGVGSLTNQVTVTPEPATAILFGIGLLAVLTFTHRRRAEV
jgi:hypothetical protein